ncbi:MAG: thiamine phosphate synthase, partial [Candidatus Omnitrophica bacterium]|nr:thiamine phosphate synthase [Candidatus Omnitrophota bacterium]
MNWRKKLLSASKLYFILDIESDLYSPSYIIKKIIKTKVVDIIQLRDKINPKPKIINLAKLLKKILYRSGILFIINDY